MYVYVELSYSLFHPSKKNKNMLQSQEEIPLDCKGFGINSKTQTCKMC